MNFVKIPRAPFLAEHLWVTAFIDSLNTIYVNIIQNFR